MEEIAATFDAAGVTPHFHQGAAEIFRLLASTPFADESPETIDRGRSLEETIRVTSEYLPSLLQSRGLDSVGAFTVIPAKAGTPKGSPLGNPHFATVRDSE